MTYSRLTLTAVAAFVAYFAFGFVVFGALPLLRNQYAKYPTVYRNQQDIARVMPFGMLAIFIGMVVLVVIFGMAYPVGANAADGARFGALIGIFAVCAFVIHNHVNLNIGLTLTIGQAIAYFLEWTLVGLVIGLLYRP